MAPDCNSILHVGAPKCGSSSLQQHLSARPEFKSDDGLRTYAYGSVTKSGELLIGRRLTNAALASGNRYVSSLPTRELHLLSGSTSNLSQQLNRIMADDTTVILSSEGWFHGVYKFREFDLLGELGLMPNVVVYIRPPLDWMNAAWWQWGAWSGQSFDNWWPSRMRALNWDRHLAAWSALEEVCEVQVGLATGDVVQAFGQTLGCDWSQVERTNSSSPRFLLRYLQDNRDLRPMHSPGVEFVLNRWAEWPSGRTPWIIHHRAQDEIMESFRPRLEKILRFVSSATRRAIEGDPRWWSTKPYENLPVDAEFEALSDADKDALIRSLIAAVKKADEENRKLRTR